MADLASARRRFAEDLRKTANLTTGDLVEAFATVPRERFLGRGPWHVLVRAHDGRVHYRMTESADPVHVYSNVLIGIDPSRGLNNGEPSSLAGWIERLAPKSGETLIHVGSGTGYYTAIFAELVGPSGHVVNCGVTHPPRAWLTCLRVGGRLLLPITASSSEGAAGVGAMYFVTRAHEGFRATYLSGVGIFPCAGGRSAELNARLLGKAKASWRNVRSFRLEQHDEAPSCWLHTSTCCLSEAPIPKIPVGS